MSTKSGEGQYVAGTVYRDSSNFDLVLLKYSTSGTLLWAWESGYEYDEDAMSVFLDNDGRAYVSGTRYYEGSSRDYITVCLDEDGNLLWERSLSSIGSDLDSPSDMVFVPPLSVVVTGHSWYFSSPPNKSMTVKYTTCDCPYQADMDGSGFLDAVDLNLLIDALFYQGSNPQDPLCPSSRADFNADGSSDAVDLNQLIDHLFFGSAAPTDPCGN